MANLSLPFDQSSPPSDIRIRVAPPPTAYVPRQNPSFPTVDGHLSASSIQRIAQPNLLWYGAEKCDAEAVARWTPERLDDLEMGQADGRTQMTGRRRVTCVFCLASRDICIRVGINRVPVLFNTFGEEAWKILESLCSECRLVLRGGCGDETFTVGRLGAFNHVPPPPSDLRDASSLTETGNSQPQGVPFSQRIVSLDQEGGFEERDRSPSRERCHKSWGSASTLFGSEYGDPRLPHTMPKKDQLEDGDEVPAAINDDKTVEVAVRDLGADISVHALDEEKQTEYTRPYSVTFENAYGPRVSYNGAFNSSRSSRALLGYGDGRPDSTLAIPGKTYPQPYRGLRHRLFIVYRRLFSLVFLGNVAALIVIALFPQINRDWTGTVSVINLTVAVLVRQDRVINTIYAVFCSVPRSWPLWIRHRAAKIYHLGGVHSGAATAAVVWFIASVAYSMKRTLRTSKAIPMELVLSWTAIALLLAMLVAAYPTMRKRYHNRFELVHRFAGWTALAIFWAQSVHSINSLREPAQTLGEACIRSPNFWLLLVVSISIASPWIHLRKVDVRAEVLSDHAVRLHFDYITPVLGSFTRMSERPLIEWHSFAVIPILESTSKRPKGYSVVVSNAGDWTKRQIQRPPTKLWIRGLPTCGVMHIARLFNRLVLVGTGSGIGPLLSFLQARPVPIRLIWSTPNPTETFGEEICEDVVAADPDCIIYDTKRLGRPDLVRMAYQAAVEFEAEAVIIIANERITKKVVYGLETRGLAAYGAIWDS